MAQFKLQWDNTNVNANPNAVSQRASYRQKSVGGVFIATGFTPTNDLAKTVSEALTPVISSNVIYEFKVQAICTQNGPTDNDNGIQEGIVFSCIAPSMNKTSDSSSITIDVTGTDIAKARFTLKKSSDNSIVITPTIINRSGNSITQLATGLQSSTSYYWQIELIATVSGVDVYSSDINQLGVSCSPYVFQTDAPPFCNPVASLTATSIETV